MVKQIKDPYAEEQIHLKAYAYGKIREDRGFWKGLAIGIIFLIIFIGLIGLCSAVSLSLSPSTFNIDAFPGETHYRNITITTDGNYAVYLNSTSNASITINYTSPIIVEGSKEIQVGFIFAGDIPPALYTVEITGSIEHYENIVNQVSSGSSGGGGSMVYVLPNGTLTYKKPVNISYEKEKEIVYVNQTEFIDKAISTGFPKWLGIGLSLVVIGIVLVGLWFWLNQREGPL